MEMLLSKNEKEMYTHFISSPTTINISKSDYSFVVPTKYNEEILKEKKIAVRCPYVQDHTFLTRKM